MHVAGDIRVAMMVAMVTSPPQRAALHGRIAQHGKEELHGPRGLECAMRKVAVVKPSYGEHPHPVGHNGHAHGYGTPADPQNPEATQVQRRKRQHTQPIDLPLICGDRRDHGVIALKPAQKSQPPACEWPRFGLDLYMFHSISIYLLTLRICAESVIVGASLLWAPKRPDAFS